MRAARGLILSALIWLTPAGAAWAEGWAGFYVPTQRPAPASVGGYSSAPGTDEGICIREILSAQARHGIPDNLLLAIGLQEAGTRRNGRFTVWPYAVNAAGTGRLFDSRDAALDWVAERQRAGVRSIDVGCMQINMRWHPEAFSSAYEGFDPGVNVDYAARFLKRLHQQTGSWLQAAGAYHSQEPQYRDIYLNRLRGNISAANERLPEFVALAGGMPPRQPARPRDTAPAADRAPDGGVRLARATWGASLGGAANARMSLYSTQPILPQFTHISSRPAG